MSSAPPRSASRISRAIPTSRTTPRLTACAFTTSTRGAARRCSASTASRAGATSTGTCSTGSWERAPGGLPGPRGVRPLGQADRPGLVHVRAPRGRGHRPPRPGGPRGRDRRGAGLGRPDRPSLGGGARGPGRAARGAEHGTVHRPGQQGVHGMAGVRRAHARPADRSDHPGRDHDRSRAGGGGRLRGAVPNAGEQGRRAALPAARAAHARRPGRRGDAGGAGCPERWDKPALVAFSDTDPVFPFPRAGERVHRARSPPRASRSGSRAPPISSRRTAAWRSPTRCSRPSETASA